MEITVRVLTGNKEMLNRCRVTVWKDALDKEPTNEFIHSLYFSEHSPIRDKWFSIQIRGIRSWIATHFCRHNIGFTPYISTQRDDKTDNDVPRDEIGQGALVNMDITLNAQAFINVSRKRLCRRAHTETIEVWDEVVNQLHFVDDILASLCVPNCVYRGGICPEGERSCGFNKEPRFYNVLSKYTGGYCKCERGNRYFWRKGG